MFGAFDAYLADAIDYPFEATWRVEDSKDRKDWVTGTVLALSSKGDERKGLLFEWFLRRESRPWWLWCGSDLRWAQKGNVWRVPIDDQ